jgi:polar amino acid transport system substrate-binding protein
MPDAHPARRPPVPAPRRAWPVRHGRPGRLRPVAWFLPLCVVLPAAACGGASPAAAPAAASSPDLNSMLPAAVRAVGRLTVLTDPVFRPISYHAAGSTISGTDPDIVRAMSRVLRLREPRFVAITDFAGLLTAVQSGRGDLAIGGITDTVQREQAVQFVDDFRLGELFVTRRGNPARISAAPASVCGRTVAFTYGAVSASAVPAMSRQCTAVGKPAIRPVGFAGVPATILAVRSGRVQVALYDDIGFSALNQANGGTLQAVRIRPYPDQLWGFAVRKGSQGGQLARALLAALKVIVADGTYHRILQAYGVSDDALASPGINLQAQARG